MSLNKKAHDGLSVVEHYVQPGQTLSSIAKDYQLPNYRGLWIYNSKVRRSLTTKGPDVIPTGRRILIPRTPAGYAKWIADLKQLKADTHDIVAAAKLDEIEARAGMWDVGTDAAAEVATFLVGIAAKCAQAVKAASLAFDAKVAEEAVVNARLGYLATILELDSSTNRLFARFDLMMKAAKKASVSGKVAEKVFDKVAGKEAALIRKMLKAGLTASKGRGIRNALELLADSTKAVLEYTDYSKPSMLRRQIMLWCIGESLEGTLADQRAKLKSIEESSRALLEREIKRVEEEQKIVWG